MAVEVDNIAEGEALLQIRTSALERPRLVTVGTQSGRDCGRATWSTDSLRLAYLCWDQKSINLHSIAVDDAASAQFLLEEPRPIDLLFAGFSAGDSHVFLHRVDAEGSNELVSVPLEPSAGPERRAQVVPMEESDWSSARLSPDGRWLAYISREAGRQEMFVRPVLSGTRVGPRVLAMPGLVEGVWWSKVNGGGNYELFVWRRERLHSIGVTTEPSLRFSDPRELEIDWFAQGLQNVDSLPDGRFLIIQAPDSEHGAAELRLIFNWTQELTRLLPVSPR